MHTTRKATKDHSPRSPTGTETSADDAAGVARFKELTETLLPSRARQERWPIRLDHCFKRICLDHAFGDVWYKHLRKPAERHISGAALERAVACAEELACGGAALLDERNRNSLQYRGKKGPERRRPA